MSSLRSRPPARPRGTSRVRLLAGAGVVVIAAAIAFGLWRATSGNDASTVPVAALPGYTEGLAGAWQRINPLFATTNDVDADLSSLVFSGLLRIGPDGQVGPDLADALPDVADEGRTYTFHLRKGLTWQDGAPLTSSDVSFTVKKLVESDFRGDPALAESWVSVVVETPDPSTIVLRLRQPSAPFLARNATIGILPEHLLGSLTAAALFEAPYNTAPVGSGPYKIQTIDNRGAVLVANGRYHFGKPAIETMRIRFYSDYPSAVRAVASGELQGLVIQDPLTDAQQTELAKIKGIVVAPYERSAYLVLYLNNDQAAFFEDPHVRRAISLGIDRRAIVKAALEGGATASSSAVAPGNWAYRKEYDHTSPDIEAARKLLADAGWKLPPATGVLTREGQEFRFTIRTDNDQRRVAVAGEIARQLEQLGIRATVASTTFSVLRRDFLQTRTYEAAVAGWDQGADPDPYFGWHSSQLGAGGLNLANFQDVVVDELIGKARTTDDVVVRKDLYKQFQEKWDALTPSVVIAYPQAFYVHSDTIKGITPGILSASSQRFYDVQKWSK